MADPIQWKNEKRKLNQLVAWEHNPRIITTEQAKRLLESLDEFGQIHAIAIGPENQIYDGHQRDAVWAASEKYGPEFVVDVRVSSRPLTERERGKLVTLLHRGTNGEWNWDELANLPEVDTEDLVAWGFKPFELGILGEEINRVEEWKGMPGFNQEDAMGIAEVKVHFLTAEDLEAFAKLIGQSLTLETRAIWFPQQAPHTAPVV